MLIFTGLVEDAMQEYKDRQRMNMWTNEEREIFREKFSQHPKNFGAIAAFLERKVSAIAILMMSLILSLSGDTLG